MDIFYIHCAGILVTVATKAQAEPGLHGAPSYGTTWNEGMLTVTRDIRHWTVQCHQRNRKLTVEIYNSFTRVSKPVIYKMFTA
jgi:hypothetical protein